MKNQRNVDLYAETQVLDSAHAPLGEQAPMSVAASDADASEHYDEYVRELASEQTRRAPLKVPRKR